MIVSAAWQRRIERCPAHSIPINLEVVPEAGTSLSVLPTNECLAFVLEFVLEMVSDDST